MTPRTRSWIKFSLRWGIAVIGITYVLWNLHLRDRVLILDEQNRPVSVPLAVPAEERDSHVTIVHPETGEPELVHRRDLVNQSDREWVTIRTPEGLVEVRLLAVDLSDDLRRARRLLIEDPDNDQGRWIDPEQAIDYRPHIPHPRVQAGLVHMVQTANGSYLLLAVVIFPLTFLLTSYRWKLLLRALEIQIPLSRVITLNMVGAFYNTFMPGTTGGDVLKAYYAAKQTTLYRTRAVMSVIIDRAIGLLALVILGGTMAAYQSHFPAARRVALVCAVILGLVVAGLFIFYHPLLRKWTGLDWLLARLPMQPQVHKAVDAMHILRQRPLLVLWALLVTFPVHMTVVISATFAGLAFDLPLDLGYYWVAVPVIVLVGSIPISPQGAGVMEVFAIYLTSRQGATVSQAFALAMSIRLVQMLWNLSGGFFVFRGGYQAPTQTEEDELMAQAPEQPAESPSMPSEVMSK
jgi:uncharacterized protein (TIRG00374 family)